MGFAGERGGPTLRGDCTLVEEGLGRGMVLGLHLVVHLLGLHRGRVKIGVLVAGGLKRALETLAVVCSIVVLKHVHGLVESFFHELRSSRAVVVGTVGLTREPTHGGALLPQLLERDPASPLLLALLLDEVQVAVNLAVLVAIEVAMELLALGEALTEMKLPTLVGVQSGFRTSSPGICYLPGVSLASMFLGREREAGLRAGRSRDPEGLRGSSI